MTTPENTIDVPPSMPVPGFRSALASRDFKLLFVGQLGAAVGNGLVQLALPFLVLQLTGSAFQLGFAYFFQFLPMLLFGIVGGVFADRWDRRITLVVADVIRALAFLSIGVIYYAGSLTVEHIYVVIFIEGTLANFFNPARAAIMPSLVPAENLRAANSLMEVSRHVGFFVAPPVGSIMASQIGPAALFLIDGGTFLLSGITVFFIVWRPPLREAGQATGLWNAMQTVLQETAAGMGVIARERILQVAMILGLALNVLVAPITVLLPIFVTNVKHGDEADFGLLVSGLLVGLIAGSLIAPAASRRLGLGHMSIVGILVLGVVISIAAWPPTLIPPLLAMTAAGLAIGALNVAQTTMLQGASGDDELGRVSATYYTVTMGIRPLSYLAMGAIASAVADIRLVFVGLGVLVLILGCFLLRMPAVREAR